MSRSPKKPHNSTRPLHETPAPNRPSGLLTPPFSQADQHPPLATMLMSPPPEETLRLQPPRPRSTPTASTPAGNSSTPGVAFRVGFSGQVISNTLSTKRKRIGLSTSSSTSSLLDSAAVEDTHGAHSKAPADATPNPKPRKQTKRSVSFAPQSPSRGSTPLPTTPTKSSRKHPSVSPTKKVLLLSPHANNPQADYMPPVPSLSREHISARRRSATPVPRYEPPSERFTPPREVICTPIASAHTPKGRSSKRKTITKSGGKPKKLVLQIKKEFPEDIDLSAPLPPPSPTEDPLLLRGPTGYHRRRRSRVSHPLLASTRSRNTPELSSTPIRDIDMDGTRLLDLNFDSAMDLTSDDTMGPPPPVFDFSAGIDGADDWSDDERTSDHEFDHSGEFTGKFKVISVPTKEDPPSSCTRERMDAWGRPISPFPRVRTGMDSEVAGDEDDGLTLPTLSSGSQSTAQLKSPSPVPFSRTQTSADDVFSPSRHPARSPTSPTCSPRPSPAPEDPTLLQDSPLPHSDEESGSPGVVTVPHKPRGPFDFDSLNDSINDSLGSDDDFYDDEIIPIHETSMDSEIGHDDPILNIEVQAGTVVREEALGATTRSLSPPAADDMPPRLQSLEDPPVRRLLTPSEPLEDPSSPSQTEFAEPVPEHIPSEISQDAEEPRSPRLGDMGQGDEGSEDEEEDEASVTRELSQPLDFDDEDAAAEREDGLANSFAKFSLLSSPNPFHPTPQTQQEFEASTSIRRPRGSFVAERSKVYEQSPAEPGVVHDDSDDDDLESMDAKVIKITSDDPMAAARAAAILRLHKYDCLEQPLPRKRRHSHTGLDSILRKARRKSMLEGGVFKSSTSFKRRQTLGGVIGDKVYIPGSPAMTLPELLYEAEASLHIEDRSTTSSPFRPLSPLANFKTPMRAPSLYQSVLRSTVVSESAAPLTTGPRKWSKDDWKRLDSCYTDERLDAAELAGLGEDEMMSADVIDVEHVVDRFIAFMGGEQAIAALGPSWSRDDLLKRARALQRKQLSGHIAPPTPSRSASILSNDTTSAPYQRFMSSMSPEASSHSSDITATDNIDPGTPFSQYVKYAELMDEAITISNTHIPTSRISTATLPEFKRGPRNSIASRVKGFLFSYLPIASKAKATPASKATNPQIGLPIPPPDLFLRPHPPIMTPAPKPAPKPAHPKELVQLQPAPLPEKPSMIPRAAAKDPRRLVDLNHVSPPPEDKGKRSSLRERRDSNTSVKDLVKTFETMDRQAERESLSRLELRRQKSIEEWNAASTRNGPHKPVWKP